MKKYSTLLGAFLFACTALLAQEAPVVQTPDEEMEDAVYIAEYQLDTTDFSEIITLYDVATGKPTGKLVYKNGNYYMENNGNLKKLTSGDLRKLFSKDEYREYQKGKSQYNGSIPLYVVAGCAGGLIAGGLAWFMYDWFRVVSGTDRWNGERFSTMPAFKGFLCVMTGMAVGIATIIPAINLHQRGSSVMGGLAYDYNYSIQGEEDFNNGNNNDNNNNNNGTPKSGKKPASNTSMRISIGGTSQGFGLALHF